MQVKSSVKLPARLLSFPLQVRQKLTHSNACGHIQVTELDNNNRFFSDILDARKQIFFVWMLVYTDWKSWNEAPLFFFIKDSYSWYILSYNIHNFLMKHFQWEKYFVNDVLLFHSSLCIRTNFCSLLVGENLRIDSVELQDELVDQLRVQSPVSLQEGAVFHQLLVKTVCPQKFTNHWAHQAHAVRQHIHLNGRAVYIYIYIYPHKLLRGKSTWRGLWEGGKKRVLFQEEGFFLYRTWRETFWKAQRDVKRYVTVSFAKKVNFSRRRSWFGPTVKTYGDKTGGGLTSNISVILGQRMSRTSHGGIPFFDSRFLCPQSEDALFRHLAGRAWLTSADKGEGLSFPPEMGLNNVFCSWVYYWPHKQSFIKIQSNLFEINTMIMM